MSITGAGSAKRYGASGNFRALTNCHDCTFLRTRTKTRKYIEQPPEDVADRHGMKQEATREEVNETLTMRRLVLICVFLGIFGPSKILAVDQRANVSDFEQEDHDAIAKIHLHLDDNQDGDLNMDETKDFIHDELKVNNEGRHSNLHGNDKHISVEDLWNTWKSNPASNWTNEDMVDWLVAFVLLPQYKQGFINSEINGSKLPRLAAQYNGLLQNNLGVKDVKHRKKIALRAMDVVIFGPPPTGHNFLKDLVLVLSVFIATAGCWFAVVQKRRARVQMDQIMSDMKVLQQAEQHLQELQNRLNQAEIDHQTALEDKFNLEARLEEELQASKETNQLQKGTDQQLQTKLQRAEEELSQLRRALRKAEKDLEGQPWRAPSLLRQWLQMTYEKESKHFHNKRALALKQMQEAKEACERIKRKRGSLLGSFRLAHDLSIDEVDQKILSARAALAEVTNELEERQHRWSQIESLCGLHVMSRNFSPGSGDGPMGGSRSRTNSVIAQALTNVANIGGVGSGRKISSSDSPWMKCSTGESPSHEEDLPPTYSSTMASVSSDAPRKHHASVACAIPASRSNRNTVCAQSLDSPSGEVKTFPWGLNDVEVASGPGGIMNGHDRPGSSHGQQSGDWGVSTEAGIATAGIATAAAAMDQANLSSSQVVSNASMESEAPIFRASNSNSPAGSRSKKRLSWFSSGKRDSSDDSANIENDDDTRRRKVKWLWKSAVRKSSMQQNGQAVVEGKSKPPSSKKLKAG